MFAADGVLKRFREGGVLFDGAMGTMLIAKGLRAGRPPEEWNLEHGSLVQNVHAAYLAAGADVVETNTFGGTPLRLRSFGLGERAGQLNALGVRVARQAVAEHEEQRVRVSTSPASQGRGRDARGKLVAFSMGPTGLMLPPVGKATEAEVRNELAAQISEAGTAYDLVVIETMFDLREALAALAIVKEIASVPVAVTMTFNKNPRGFFTIMGDEAGRTVRALEAAGADIVGANCSIASPEMVELAPILRRSTALPLLCQPNAGSPHVRDGVPVYDQTPEEFSRDALLLFETGVNAVGGCCGTTPAFIREVCVGLSSH